MPIVDRKGASIVEIIVQKMSPGQGVVYHHPHSTHTLHVPPYGAKRQQIHRAESIQEKAEKSTRKQQSERTNEPGDCCAIVSRDARGKCYRAISIALHATHNFYLSFSIHVNVFCVHSFLSDVCPPAGARCNRKIQSSMTTLPLWTRQLDRRQREASRRRPRRSRSPRQT